MGSCTAFGIGRTGRYISLQLGCIRSGSKTSSSMWAWRVEASQLRTSPQVLQLPSEAGSFRDCAVMLLDDEVEKIGRWVEHGPGCEGARLCRWKMRGVPRSKNKNSSVREMSFPPGLWLAGRAGSCEQRGRDPAGAGRRLVVSHSLLPSSRLTAPSASVTRCRWAATGMS